MPFLWHPGVKMTGLEQSLLGVLIFMSGGLAKHLILPGISRRDHAALKELTNTKFEAVESRLERIERKIDENNGKGK